MEILNDNIPIEAKNFIYHNLMFNFAKNIRSFKDFLYVFQTYIDEEDYKELQTIVYTFYRHRFEDVNYEGFIKMWVVKKIEINIQLSCQTEIEIFYQKYIFPSLI